MFRGRKLLIAARHKKEKAIAPILERSLGVTCQVPPDFDSDAFGTFAGEVERKLDPVSTARAKCEKALDEFGGDLAIASEGSFGPHPQLFLMNANDETLVLVDRKNGLEIVANYRSLKTNLFGAEVTSLMDVPRLVEQTLFPSHGLIVRNRQAGFNYLAKGIVDFGNLYAHLWICLKKFGEAFVETDMRAYLNPTRMEAIEQATLQLARQIDSRCPQCDCPGFWVSDVISGLPCKVCGTPTRSPLRHLYRCNKCRFEKSTFYPNGHRTEEPQFCDFCNP